MKDFSEKTRKTILENANHTCRICGFQDRDMVHVDHIVPRNFPGSTNDISNAAALCWKCNAVKGDILNIRFPQTVSRTDDKRLQYRRRRRWEKYCLGVKKLLDIAA